MMNKLRMDQNKKAFAGSWYNKTGCARENCVRNGIKRADECENRPKLLHFPSIIFFSPKTKTI